MIAVTAFPHDATRDRAQRLEIRLLAKPFDFDSLRDAVEAALDSTLAPHRAAKAMTSNWQGLPVAGAGSCSPRTTSPFVRCLRRLERRGLSSHHRDGRRGARQLLRESALKVRFDLILTDVKMPGGSGLDVFDQLRRNGEHAGDCRSLRSQRLDGAEGLLSEQCSHGAPVPTQRKTQAEKGGARPAPRGRSCAGCRIRGAAGDRRARPVLGGGRAGLLAARGRAARGRLGGRGLPPLRRQGGADSSPPARRASRSSRATWCARSRRPRRSSARSAAATSTCAFGVEKIRSTTASSS